MKKRGSPLPRSIRKPKRAVVLPPAEPEDVTMKKARRLPLFGPGIVIPVPAHLYPAYTQLYNLEPMTLQEVSQTEERLGYRKPAGTVWVKRVPQARTKQTES